MEENRTRPLAACALVLAACALALVLVEGMLSLWRFDAPWPSLTASLVHRLRAFAGGEVSSDPWPLPVISDPEVLDALLPALQRDGVGLGYAPRVYHRHAKGVALNEERDGCLVQRPDLDKRVTYLRAGLWEPFRPVTAFWDTQARLGPEVREFLERYAVRLVRLRTNASGERLTLPVLDAPDVVLVGGDSVAHGSVIDEHETLASQLQARDASRRYVNLGVAGAEGEDVVCNLEAAADRYRGRIRELVYVYCENDFDPGDPMGEPEDVVRWLAEFAEREEIGAVTVVYAPYVYNIVPDLTRFRGYKGWSYPHHASQRQRLEAGVRSRGFGWLDVSELALAAVERERTRLAALTLFSDEVHWSPRGSGLVAERLLTLGAPR